MNPMKYSLLLLSLVLANAAHAAELTCSGEDPTDVVVNVKLDLAKNLLIVNGEENEILKPGAKEAENVIGVTEAYATKEYGDVYITLVKKSETEFTIHQVKKKNNKVMSTVDLTCESNAQ